MVDDIERWQSGRGIVTTFENGTFISDRVGFLRACQHACSRYGDLRDSHRDDGPIMSDTGWTTTFIGSTAAV